MEEMAKFRLFRCNPLHAKTMSKKAEKKVRFSFIALMAFYGYSYLELFEKFLVPFLGQLSRVACFSIKWGLFMVLGWVLVKLVSRHAPNSFFK